MLQNEMDDPPTICMEKLGLGFVQWNNEGVIYSPELDAISKEFDGHLISNGRLIVGGLE